MSSHMTDEAFLAVIHQNPVTRTILERLPRTSLKDAWLVGGALFQTVWNVNTGRDPSYGIRDYDIFYFDDTDLSWQAEDDAISMALEALDMPDQSIEIRNQARVHLWYQQKFAQPYSPLRRTTEGVDRFLSPACMVAATRDLSGDDLTYAPHGFDDMASMVLRPAPRSDLDIVSFHKKANRWKELWPELTIAS